MNQPSSPRSCYLFVKPWEVRRVPGNHKLVGGDAEKVEKVRKMTREAEREEGKEKRSLQKMEEDHCTGGGVMRLLVKPWEAIGPRVIMLMMMMVMLRHSVLILGGVVQF